MWHFSRCTRNNFWCRLKNFWPQNWHSRWRFKEEDGVVMAWKSENSLPCKELMRKSLWASRICLTKVSNLRNWAAQHKHPQDWDNKSWPWRIFRKSFWWTDNKWHSKPKLYPKVWIHKGQFNRFIGCWELPVLSDKSSVSYEFSDNAWSVLYVSNDVGDGKRLKNFVKLIWISIFFWNICLFWHNRWEGPPF